MRLLDLFCGAGGSGEGYRRAGFEVVGVDIEPQPNYPFEFIRADALAFLDSPRSRRFDAVHASPPCQGYIQNLNRMNAKLGRVREHPRLIAPTRVLLPKHGGPFVIENIEDARAELINPVLICGSSVGTSVRRHRLFEANFPLLVPPCAHGMHERKWRVPLGDPRTSKDRLSRFVAVYGSTRYRGELADRRAAMGIDWMTNAELVEAIPPAYTELIGRQLLDQLARAAP